MSSKNTEFVLSMPRSIFILYLIIAGSFLGGLLGCKTQNMMINNMAVKHLMGVMTMFFFIVMIDSDSKVERDPATQLFYSLILYFMFILTTRMDHRFWVAFIISLFLIYILYTYRNNSDSEEEKERYTKHQMTLTYISAFIVLIGFAIYLNEKRTEYGDNFSFSTFILGKPECDSLKK